MELKAGALGLGAREENGLFVLFVGVPPAAAGLLGQPILEFHLSREELEPLADAITKFRFGLVIPFSNGKG